MNIDREAFLDWCSQRGMSRDSAKFELDSYLRGNVSTTTLRIRTLLDTYELVTGKGDYARGWEDGYDAGFLDGAED